MELLFPPEIWVLWALLSEEQGWLFAASPFPCCILFLHQMQC